METEAQIADRWRSLRQLLIEQLAQFQTGTLQVHAGADNVSAAAITRLKREIDDFDGLIRMSDKRNGKKP